MLLKKTMQILALLFSVGVTYANVTNAPSLGDNSISLSDQIDGSQKVTMVCNSQAVLSQVQSHSQHAEISLKALFEKIKTEHANCQFSALMKDNTQLSLGNVSFTIKHYPDLDDSTQTYSSVALSSRYNCAASPQVGIEYANVGYAFCTD